MFVKYTLPLPDPYINERLSVLSTVPKSIDIPINLEYQIVDTAELIERLFVSTETQKAVNPILDYDKVRFIPLDLNKQIVPNITLNLSFLGPSNTLLTPTYYSNINIEDNDIKFQRAFFTESFLMLSFYDSDNAMTQNLINEVRIYNNIYDSDKFPAGTQKPNIAGQPKPASQIQVKAILSSPILSKKSFYEGYHIYTYKDDISIGGTPKYLYMKASYFNAKTGKFTNFMTVPTPLEINQFVKKLYTKYELYRDTTGFYYKINNTYSTNVTYNQNIINPNNQDILIELYQAQTL